MSQKLPLARIEDLLIEIKDNTAGGMGGGSGMLNEAKAYTDEKADEVLAEAKDYTDGEVSAALGEAKSYAESQASSVLGEANSYTDEHEQKPNPHNITPEKIGAETPAGAQSKADAAEASAKSYADSLVQDMETKAGAQQKADVAEANARDYANSLIQDLETKAGAQAKADVAESNAKAFVTSLLAGESPTVLTSIVLKSPDGTLFAISVDDEGSLIATEIEE